jgi:hypothetical protein
MYLQPNQSFSFQYKITYTISDVFLLLTESNTIRTYKYMETFHFRCLNFCIFKFKFCCFNKTAVFFNRLCGLLVIVPGYRYRGSGFDSRRYQIFLEVVGLERGPLSLVIITEELLKLKIAAPGLENREYGHGDPLRCPRDTLYPQKLALT